MRGEERKLQLDTLFIFQFYNFEKRAENIYLKNNHK